MKVIILGSYSPSLIQFRGALIADIVNRGYDVLACAPNPDIKVFNELKRIGARCKSIYLHRTGINPLNDIYTLLYLLRLFRTERPNYLLSYTIKPVVYGSLAAKIARVPHVYSMITGLGYTFSEAGNIQLVLFRMIRILYRIAMHCNKGVFFQNPDNYKVFKERGLLKENTRSFLINGSGVDTTYFKRTPLPQTHSFLLIARLIRDKGIFEYVEAAREVKRKWPEVRFRLVGWFDSNPSRITKAELKSWTEEGVIEYLGPLNDVRPALRQCKVYVLPSYHEGTPRTVLEAMSMGRPILTTDAPGCRETVQPGVNGFLVPVRDHLSLSIAMIKFIENPELVEQMGLESRRIAEEKYDVKKVNRVIIDSMGL